MSAAGLCLQPGVCTWKTARKTMAKKDFYEVLGVLNQCVRTKSKGYRKHAMKHHTDRNQGDAQGRRREVSRNQGAHEMSWTRKTAAYDQQWFCRRGPHMRGGP
jgi:molecular chaperone DnaJ